MMNLIYSIIKASDRTKIFFIDINTKIEIPHEVMTFTTILTISILTLKPLLNVIWFVLCGNNFTADK